MLETVIIGTAIAIFGLIALVAFSYKSYIDYLIQRYKLTLVRELAKADGFIPSTLVDKIYSVITFKDAKRYRRVIIESTPEFANLNSSLASLVISDLLRRHGYLCVSLIIDN